MEGMSTYSTVAWVTFGGSKSRPSSSRRASGTRATPVRTAVDPMRVSDWTPVRIVNREVLPTMGKPMMAVFIYGECLQGNFHLAEDFFDDALARVGAALHQGGAGVDHHAMSEERRGEALDVVR